MNFGTSGFLELVFFLLVWGIPLVVIVWFVRTLTAMAASLQDIANRLGSLERAVRDASYQPPPR
jgi:hypothetical protein